jgi:hypothetical protein
MRFVALLVAIFGSMVAEVGVALADLAESQTWFEGFPIEERKAIQYDLIWAANYSGVVDGKFGQQTYSSLTKYQEANEQQATGELSATGIEKLKADADRAAQAFDLSKYLDERAEIEYLVPQALASSSLPANSKNGSGTKYSSADNTLSIESFRIAGLVSFEDQYRRLSSSNSVRTVTYSIIRPTYFVTTGHFQAQSFYLIAYNASSETRGISIAWATDRHDLAKLALAVAGSVSVAGTAVATPAAPSSEPPSQPEVPQARAAGQPTIPSSLPVAEPAQPPVAPSRPAVARPTPPVAKSHTYRGFRDISGLDRPQSVGPVWPEHLSVARRTPATSGLARSCSMTVSSR